MKIKSLEYIQGVYFAKKSHANNECFIVSPAWKTGKMFTDLLFHFCKHNCYDIT